MAESKKVTTTLARAKQNNPAGKKAVAKKPAANANSEYVPLFPLLANYWDKRLSELPEELRARVSMQKEKRLVGQRPKFDASGELECDADGHYPVYEDVYAEHETGDWIFSWDALTPEKRQMIASQIDDRHDPALKNVRQVSLILGAYSIKGEWPHWAGKPTLVADEAIPLMNGLDPGSWRNRHNRTFHQQLPDEWVVAIERGLKIAEGEKVGHQSPADWLAWGRSHGLDKPTMKSDQGLREPDICMWPLFAQAVAEVERIAQEEAQKNDYYEKYGANPSARIYPKWQKRINEIAEEEKSKSRLNRYPTKGVAAKLLAIELVAKDLVAPNIISSSESLNKIEKTRVNIERHTQKEWGKKRLA